MTFIPQTCLNHVGFIRHLLMTYRQIDVTNAEVWSALFDMAGNDATEAEHLIQFVLEHNDGFNDLAERLNRQRSIDNKLCELQRQIAGLEIIVANASSTIVLGLTFFAIASSMAILVWMLS